MSYRAAHLLALRPPLALRGHTFVLLDAVGDYAGPPLERCVACHLIVARHLVAEGLLPGGRWCPGLLRALESEA